MAPALQGLIASNRGEKPDKQVLTVRRTVPLLIVGAGPFGLAMSAWAGASHIDHVVVGRPMEFWKSHMPDGMRLRSGCDWHYDPFNEETIDRYLRTKDLERSDVEPMSLDSYLGYCQWFQKRKAIQVIPARVERLNDSAVASGFFEALLQDGESITARNVVLAIGFRYFKNVPEPYPVIFPPGRWAHTCDFVDLAPVKGKRVLIIGGRQSAFEWAVLAREHGAASVSLCYRHPTPAFARSDWSWVNPLVDSMGANPGWFRRLSAERKEEVNRRFWAEGRLKLEPWLTARLADDNINLFPQSEVTTCKELSGGDLEIQLSNGAKLAIDQVVLATGYKVDVGRIPFLAKGNILERLEVRNGFPVLDEHFQSNLPGLFFTSICASQDFGSFFAFTVSVRVSATLIGSALRM
jgi:cation diffusion facilitator CzcD-associated flavoprotein CzcO